MLKFQWSFSIDNLHIFQIRIKQCKKAYYHFMSLNQMKIFYQLILTYVSYACIACKVIVLSVTCFNSDIDIKIIE